MAQKEKRPDAGGGSTSGLCFYTKSGYCLEQTKTIHKAFTYSRDAMGETLPLRSREN